MRSPLAARAAAVATTAAIMISGCGIRQTGIISAGEKPLTGAQRTSTTVYLVDRRGRLVPVVRPGLPSDPYHAVTQLGNPPTAAEERRGLRNAVPRLELNPRLVQEVGRDTAELDVTAIFPEPEGGRRGLSWSRTALAQVACTAETIPGISGVWLTRVLSARDTNAGAVTGQLGSPGPSWGRFRCDQFRDLMG